MATLTLERVSKIYRQRRRVPVHAVIDVSMAIQDGEIVGLLGSSGCGKTSTLRMIAGFEAVTHGIIAIKGRSIHQLPPAKRNVAMAFEGYSLYPPLTVRDNIAFALKAARLGQAEIARKLSHIRPSRNRPDSQSLSILHFRWPTTTRVAGSCARAQGRSLSA